MGVGAVEAAARGGVGKQPALARRAPVDVAWGGEGEGRGGGSRLSPGCSSTQVKPAVQINQAAANHAAAARPAPVPHSALRSSPSHCMHRSWAAAQGRGACRSRSPPRCLKQLPAATQLLPSACPGAPLTAGAAHPVLGAPAPVAAQALAGQASAVFAVLVRARLTGAVGRGIVSCTPMGGWQGQVRSGGRGHEQSPQRQAHRRAPQPPHPWRRRGRSAAGTRGQKDTSSPSQRMQRSPWSLVTLQARHSPALDSPKPCQHSRQAPASGEQRRHRGDSASSGSSTQRPLLSLAARAGAAAAPGRRQNGVGEGVAQESPRGSGAAGGKGARRRAGDGGGGRRAQRSPAGRDTTLTSTQQQRRRDTEQGSHGGCHPEGANSERAQQTGVSATGRRSGMGAACRNGRLVKTRFQLAAAAASWISWCGAARRSSAPERRPCPANLAGGCQLLVLGTWHSLHPGGH